PRPLGVCCIVGRARRIHHSGVHEPHMRAYRKRWLRHIGRPPGPCPGATAADGPVSRSTATGCWGGGCSGIPSSHRQLARRSSPPPYLRILLPGHQVRAWVALGVHTFAGGEPDLAILGRRRELQELVVNAVLARADNLQGDRGQLHRRNLVSHRPRTPPPQRASPPPVIADRSAPTRSGSPCSCPGWLRRPCRSCPSRSSSPRQSASR